MIETISAEIPDEFLRQYQDFTSKVGKDIDVFVDRIAQPGAHPYDYRDFECAFAARHIRKSKPIHILDIGSRRTFIAGLCAHHDIVSVDIRHRQDGFDGEELVIANASELPFPDETFDLVLSLNALEHFGLGRYGDRIDVNGDARAFSEWRRVTKRSGRILFSTTIASYGGAIAFNAHRIYGLDTLRAFCSGMKPVEESFFCRTRNANVDFASLNTPSHNWDVYAGYFIKEA